MGRYYKKSISIVDLTRYRNFIHLSRNHVFYTVSECIHVYGIGDVVSVPWSVGRIAVLRTHFSLGKFPYGWNGMMKTETQFVALNQLRNALKTNDTSNGITRFQIRDTTGGRRVCFHKYGGINKQRKRHTVEQKIK